MILVSGVSALPNGKVVATFIPRHVSVVFLIIWWIILMGSISFIKRPENVNSWKSNLKFYAMKGIEKSEGTSDSSTKASFVRHQSGKKKNKQVLLNQHSLPFLVHLLRSFEEASAAAKLKMRKLFRFKLRRIKFTVFLFSDFRPTLFSRFSKREI